jgi:cation diffusion facilitator CzcD-associated flavoprotein CzcO
MSLHITYSGGKLLFRHQWWKTTFPSLVVDSPSQDFTFSSRPLRDRKVENKFPREFSFPPSNILFFPGQYFSVGVGKQNFAPGKFYFHDTKQLQ